MIIASNDFVVSILDCKFNLYRGYEERQMLQCESVTRDEPWGLVYITQGVSTAEACIVKVSVQNKKKNQSSLLKHVKVQYV